MTPLPDCWIVVPQGSRKNSHPLETERIPCKSLYNNNEVQCLGMRVQRDKKNGRTLVFEEITLTKCQHLRGTQLTESINYLWSASQFVYIYSMWYWMGIPK